MRVKYIIFDLDGTLIDSSDGVVAAVNYSLRQMGQPERTADDIKPFIGYSLRLMYPSFTDVPYEELHRHFQTKAAETVVSSTVVLPGVEDTLRDLAARGYRLAIASTKIKRHIQGIIDKFNWKDLISAYAGGDEVTHVKPHPEILLLTLKRLSANPDETVVVGDTINDIEAARMVPMTSVAVNSPYGGTERLLKSKPDFFVESIADVPGILNRLQKEAI
ncbi:MAG: HAD family hydrolase [Candidatus Zixiibacteriota bacterium]